MGTYRGFVVAMAVALATMRPAVAAAQGAIGWLPIEVGQKVTVTTADGQKFSGKVVNLTPATVEISDGGKIKNVAAADVVRLQEKDPTTNGVIKGVFIVGATGFLAGALAEAASASGQIFGQLFGALLGAEPEPPPPTHYILYGTLGGMALGAVLGHAIDSGKERTLFQREAPMSVSVRPIVSNAGKGIGVSVRW